MVYKQKKEMIIAKTKKIMALIELRDHVYIDGSYQNRSSILVIWCSKHNTEHITTFYNYERSRTGCKCCGKDKVRKKLTKRQFSSKTRLKMSMSATNRPKRSLKQTRWRETHKYRKWRNNVLSLYNDKCAITDMKAQEKENLEVHHLYGAKNYPQLTYINENRIVLSKTLHTMFHKKYGYHKNTVDQFLNFLNHLLTITKSKLISSQGELENSKGSETRAYDPERIMKLHERLERLSLL